VGKRKEAPKKAPVWKRAFLAALAETGIVTRAADAAGITTKTVYSLREVDEAFAEEWRLARESAADRMETEALRRALEGVEEPVFGSGGTGVGTVEVGSIRRYSDTLLIFMLKGIRPEKYRERRELSGKLDGSLEVKNLAELVAALAKGASR
jgi:hypothetical protein